MTWPVWLDHQHCKTTGDHWCSRVKAWWLVGAGYQHAGFAVVALLVVAVVFLVAVVVAGSLPAPRSSVRHSRWKTSATTGGDPHE